MTIHVRAVYERGILRPVQPLPLDEGETVDVTIAQAEPTISSTNAEMVTRRLQEAATLADWIEATKLLPTDDGGYDIVEALHANRIWSGERPLVPDEGATP